MFARAGWIGLAWVVVTGVTTPLQAQTAACRSVPATEGPPRTVITCRGVMIEVERDARYGLGDPGGDGTPRAMQLEGGAALIDVAPNSGRQFQIQTPHAIASVRGTQWLVDAGPAASSVFVVSGEVAVTAGAVGTPAIMVPGQGVDVSPGGGTLNVAVWGEPRVRAALARFGR